MLGVNRELHPNDFAKLAIQFIDGGALRMRSGKAWDKAHTEARIGVALNYC